MPFKCWPHFLHQKISETRANKKKFPRSVISTPAHPQRKEYEKLPFCFGVSTDFPQRARSPNLPSRTFPLCAASAVSPLDTLQLHVALGGSSDCTLIHLRSCSVLRVNPAGLLRAKLRVQTEPEATSNVSSPRRRRGPKSWSCLLFFMSEGESSF